MKVSNECRQYSPYNKFFITHILNYAVEACKGMAKLRYYFDKTLSRLNQWSWMDEKLFDVFTVVFVSCQSDSELHCAVLRLEGNVTFLEILGLSKLNSCSHPWFVPNFTIMYFLLASYPDFIHYGIFDNKWWPINEATRWKIKEYARLCVTFVESRKTILIYFFARGLLCSFKIFFLRSLISFRRRGKE